MILWVRGEDWSDGRWSLEGRRVSAWVGNDSRVMGEKERNTCPRVSQYHQAEVVRGTGLRRVARRVINIVVEQHMVVQMSNVEGNPWSGCCTDVLLH